MKTLTNYILLIKEGNLSDKTTSDILLPFIERASIEVQRIVTAEKYAEYLTDLEQDDPAGETLEVQKAETNLALSFSIIPLGTRSSADGGFIDSIGFKDGETRLLSMDDLEKLQAYYQGVSDTILQPYIPLDDDENPDAPDSVFLPDHSFLAI